MQKIMKYFHKVISFYLWFNGILEFSGKHEYIRYLDYGDHVSNTDIKSKVQVVHLYHICFFPNKSQSAGEKRNREI